MISRYEHGISAPELDVLIRLAIAINVGEFRIGDHLIVIKTADGVAARTGPEQMRLEFGKQYFFDGGTSRTRIQPVGTVSSSLQRSSRQTAED